MISRPFIACAVQMTSTPDYEATLSHAANLIARAAAAGASLVGLPEHFPQICEKQEDTAAQAAITYPLVHAWMAEQARRHGITLFGTTYCPDGDRVRNRLLVFDASGERIAFYDKRHLFDVALGGQDSIRESDVVVPGEAVTVANLGELGVLGLSICYDLRFPELYRAMKDVDIIVVPSAFTETTGKAHWETLIRARAIENLAYVLAPAQGGYHVNGRETHGDSMIVDPWGVVLDRLPRGSGVVSAGVNPQYLKRLRGSLPALKHRILHRI